MWLLDWPVNLNFALSDKNLNMLMCWTCCENSYIFLWVNLKEWGQSFSNFLIWNLAYHTSKIIKTSILHFLKTKYGNCLKFLKIREFRFYWKIQSLYFSPNNLTTCLWGCRFLKRVVFSHTPIQRVKLWL